MRLFGGQMQPEQTLDVFGIRLSSEEKKRMRDLWKEHSRAEEARDIGGLLATLTPDCEYILMAWIDGKPRRWKGHQGAADFYTALLGAFKDIHFEAASEKVPHKLLVDGVPYIGLLEESIVTGTHVGEWLGVPPSGKFVSFRVFIYFPWDFVAKRFKGEVIEIHNLDNLININS